MCGDKGAYSFRKLGSFRRQREVGAAWSLPWETRQAIATGLKTREWSGSAQRAMAGARGSFWRSSPRKPGLSIPNTRGSSCPEGGTGFGDSESSKGPVLAPWPMIDAGGASRWASVCEESRNGISDRGQLSRRSAWARTTTAEWPTGIWTAWPRLPLRVRSQSHVGQSSSTRIRGSTSQRPVLPPRAVTHCLLKLELQRFQTTTKESGASRE